MTRTILDIHILQTVPPSNLNRDDTGTPKSALYGGVRRARVSSQAWKRATRNAFHDLLDPAELGVRTRQVAELVAGRIVKLDSSIDDRTAWGLAAAVVEAATKSKVEPPKRAADKAKRNNEPEPAPEAKYLMFLSARQIEGLAELAVKGRADIAAFLKHKDNKAAPKQIANSRHSIDIALFGRMVADDATINVDAAVQVAHAISVHAADNESDYYTGVDDRKKKEADEDLGAAMIGTVEFNSATLYRYAALDVDRLADNLGKGLTEDETAPVRRAVEAFLDGFIRSMPTGKVNTFANHTLPDAIIVKLRGTRPISFVAAFEEPCTSQKDGFLGAASERLARFVPELEHAYDEGDGPTWVLRVGANTAPLAVLGTEVGFKELISAVGTEVERRQRGPA